MLLLKVVKSSALPKVLNGPCKYNRRKEANLNNCNFKNNCGSMA